MKLRLASGLAVYGIYTNATAMPTNKLATHMRLPRQGRDAGDESVPRVVEFAVP